MEGLEVDYMSRSSSESEEEFQVKIILLMYLEMCTPVLVCKHSYFIRSHL